MITKNQNAKMFNLFTHPKTLGNRVLVKKLHIRRRNLRVELLEDRRVLATDFYDSFENGLGDHWQVISMAAESRVAIRDLVSEGFATNRNAIEFAKNGNANSLVFDTAVATTEPVLAMAILTVDLSEVTRGIMTFQHFRVGATQDVIPEVHTTNTPGKGLSVSKDGQTWFRLQAINGRLLQWSTHGVWQPYEYDLSQEFSRINFQFDAGIGFTNNIQFKFSHFDNRSLPQRGWAIDELRIQNRSDSFDPTRPAGVFHRFSLDGEDEQDYYFRVALFGNVNATTPILVHVHGTNGDVDLNSLWNWSAFVVDNTASIDSLIVIAPAFVEAGTPGSYSIDRYSYLSWNPNNDRAADLVLLQTIDAVASHDIGDSSQLRLWGFSAGGQFAGRFLAKHPDKVAAAVVGGPSSHILPDDTVSYPQGIAPHGAHPHPDETPFDVESFLKSNVMYWVGQDDNDPAHPMLQRFASVDSSQGISRLNRAINQFSAMQYEAEKFNLEVDTYRHELVIKEGRGHGVGFEDLNEIYDFLISPPSTAPSTPKVHARIVQTPTISMSLDTLPLTLQDLTVEQTYFVELWVESTTPQTVVDIGFVELFVDPQQTELLAVELGVFGDGTAAAIDSVAGRVRSIGGGRTIAKNPDFRFDLIGRVEIRTRSQSPIDQLLYAIQRSSQGPFTLSDGTIISPIFLPTPRTMLRPQSNTVGVVQGQVYRDLSRDGLRDRIEDGVAGRSVWLSSDPNGPSLFVPQNVEPDDFFGHGSYLTRVNPAVTLTGHGSNVIQPAVVALERPLDSATGAFVFGTHSLDGGRNSFFSEGQADLRAEFALPTNHVAIDVSRSGSRLGVMNAYNKYNELIATVLSSAPSVASIETIEIDRPQADIAYAIISGRNGGVRLDNLRFSSSAVAITDADGYFRVDSVPTGQYFVNLDLESNEVAGTYFSGFPSFETSVDHRVTTLSIDIDRIDLPPTIGPVDALQLDEDFDDFLLEINGISFSGGLRQQVSVDASVSNSELFQGVNVDYSAPGESAILRLVSKLDAVGTATIRLVITDGGLDRQLSTPDDNRLNELFFDVHVLPVNDAPHFFMGPTLAMQENNGVEVRYSDWLTGIAPGPSTALDERASQNVLFSIVPIAGTTGLLLHPPRIEFNQSPQSWPRTASLFVTPSPFVFGTGVYEVTATDSDAGNPMSFSRELILTINPINDPPIAFDRLLSVDEAVEASGQTATLAFTAADLIAGRTGETSSRAANVPASVPPQFNESEQTLKVVAFAIPGQTNVDVANLPGGVGTVTRVLRSGGTVRFVFSGGAFVSGTYTPPIDFNLNPLFGGLDTFSYVVEDDGKTTILGPGGGVVYLPPERSGPANVTLRVAPVNDPPFIPQFAPMPIRLNESKALGDQVVHLFGGSGNQILPGPATALDELAEQMVSVQFVAVSVPGGNTPGPNSLMAAAPTIDVDGRVTWSINPYAFGVAVYDLVATDDHPSNPRSTTRRFTIAVDPTNDPPVAFPRTLEIHEAVEADDEVATLLFTAGDLLTGRTGETPARAAELPANVPLLFDESEQTLKVVAFRIDGQPPVDVNSLAGGAGTVTRTLASGGVIEFVFADGAFVSGNYRPPADFNEGALFGGLDTFSYVVEDDGKTTILGPGGGVVYLPRERSNSASVTLRVLPANDPPLIPEFSNLPVRLDETKTVGNQVVHLFGDSGNPILPGPATALDELAEQAVSVQLVAISVPGGNTPGPNSLMAAAPTIELNGRLTLSINPHAFGIAVYDLVATDGHPTDPRSTTRRLTITVDPKNDAPVAFERIFELQEAVEADGEVATLVFTAGELLSGLMGETAARAAGLPTNVPVLFDESEQTLKVVAFQVDGQPPVDVTGLPGGAGTVTRTLASGGVVEFVFAGGAFASGTYIPPSDFNEDDIFGGSDTFSYIIEDDGKTTIPGPGGGVVYLPPRRSASVNVTLRVLAVNDPPLIPKFSSLPLRIDEPKSAGNQVVHLFGDSDNSILPGPATALDELAEQAVSAHLVAISVPGGNTPGPNSLMAAAPTIELNGRLTLSINPHAFGIAVYDLVATDDHPTDPRSTTRRLTITVDPKNDAPVAFERIFELQEAVEADGEVATLVFTAGELLSGRMGETAASAAGLPANVPVLFDESEQSLKVVAFQVDGQPPVDVSALSDGAGTVTRTLASGGVIEFVFAGGAFVSGTYTPPTDFNEDPLFGGLDRFTYIIEDDGKTTIPATDGATVFLSSERSQPMLITLRVLATNDPPQFESLSEVVIAEVSSHETISIVGWATNIQPGPASTIDEHSTQDVLLALVSELSTIPVGLFSSQPIVLRSGDLQLFPAPHANGTAILVIQATDMIKPGLEIPSGFVSRNSTATVTVTIEPINDPPQFTPGPDFNIGTNRDPWSQVWAIDILPGPPEAIDELAIQTVEFELTVASDHSGLFAEGGLPTMDAQGVLRFTPHSTRRGQATIAVVAIDSAQGRSEPVTFTITLEDIFAAPVLGDSLTGTYWGRSLVIDLLQHATASPVAINVNSIMVESGSTHGTVTMLGDGRVRYVATEGFVGEDAIAFTVRDVDGRVSNLAVVSIHVVGSPAQNPLNVSDVNDDGDVHPLDALLVLVRLAQAQRDGVIGGLLAASVADETPQRFYDVDGNGRIEPLDALMVLTQIARNNRSGNSEGESWLSETLVMPTISVAPPSLRENRNDDESANDRTSLSLPGESSGEGAAKFAAFDWTDDDWNAIESAVADALENQPDDTNGERELADAVWGQRTLFW